MSTRDASSPGLTVLRGSSLRSFRTKIRDHFLTVYNVKVCQEVLNNASVNNNSLTFDTTPSNTVNVVTESALDSHSKRIETGQGSDGFLPCCIII